MGAMQSNIGHLQFSQIQNAADHVAMLALDAAFLMRQRYRTANFLMRRFGGFLGAFIGTHPDQGQNPPNHPLHRSHDRRQDCHDPAQRRRHGQCEGVRAGDGQRLGQHFGEHQNHQCHHAGGDEHGAGTQTVLQQRRHQRGRQNIDEGIAQQQGADQPLAIRHQAIDVPGGAAAILFQLVHPSPRHGGERCFRAREKGRGDQQQQNDAEGKKQHGNTGLERPGSMPVFRRLGHREGHPAGPDWSQRPFPGRAAARS